MGREFFTMAPNCEVKITIIFGKVKVTPNAYEFNK